MLAEYRMGALAVVQNVADSDWINRRLKQLDPGLFVEKQLTFRDEEVWCVVHDTGEHYGEERFVTVYEHRGPDDKPIPYLTDGIVEEMQRRAREHVGNVREAQQIRRRREQERQERMLAEHTETYREIATDFETHRSIGNFMVVPRSSALARTRARVRSQTVEQRLAAEAARRIARRMAG